MKPIIVVDEGALEPEEQKKLEDEGDLVIRKRQGRAVSLLVHAVPTTKERAGRAR